MTTSQSLLRLGSGAGGSLGGRGSVVLRGALWCSVVLCGAPCGQELTPGEELFVPLPFLSAQGQRQTSQNIDRLLLSPLYEPGEKESCLCCRAVVLNLFPVT